jgi:nucleotide-binding universal stress UspA family protein
VFKTIVWATDGSQNADLGAFNGESARRRARGFDRRRAHRAKVRDGGGPGVLRRRGEGRSEARSSRRGALAEGFDATLKIVNHVGPQPAHAIADAAREVGADLIVVGTRGDGAVAGLVLGSVTLRLLHVAPCPVLAVPGIEHSANEGDVDAGEPRN